MYPLSNLFKRAVNYLFFIGITRICSIKEVGDYSAYLNLATFLVLLTNFGYNEYVIVYGTSKKKLIHTFFPVIALSGLTFLAILFVSLLWPIADHVLLISLLFKLFFETSFSLIVLSYLQVRNNVKLMTISNVVTGVLMCFSTFLGVTLSLSLVEFIWLINLSILFGAINLLFAFKGLSGMNFNSIRFIKGNWRRIKYFGLVAISVPLYMMAPNFIAALLLESNNLAIYQVAYSLSNIVLLFSLSLAQDHYHSVLKVRSDLDLMIQALRKLALKIIISNLIILILFYFLGSYFITLLYKNSEYLHSLHSLSYLLIANIFQALAVVAAMFLVVNQQQKLKFHIQVELIIIAWILGFILISYMGVDGVLYTYLVIFGYAFFRYFFAGRRFYLENIK